MHFFKKCQVNLFRQFALSWHFILFKQDVWWAAIPELWPVLVPLLSKLEPDNVQLPIKEQLTLRILTTSRNLMLLQRWTKSNSLKESNGRKVLYFKQRQLPSQPNFCSQFWVAFKKKMLRQNVLAFVIQTSKQKITDFLWWHWEAPQDAKEHHPVQRIITL